MSGRRKNVYLLALMFALLLPGVGIAQTKYEQAISDITFFAETICGKYQLEGRNTEINASGKVSAFLNGIVKKFADVGIEAEGSFDTDKYISILQADLDEEWINVRNCRLKIWDDLKGQLLGPMTQDDIEKLEEIENAIHSGDVFYVVLDHRDGDAACGIQSGTGYLGNLIAGEIYKVSYDKSTGVWVTEGPGQFQDDCSNYSSYLDGNKLVFDPQKMQINIWVGVFRYDQSGNLFYGDTRVGRIVL